MDLVLFLNHFESSGGKYVSWKNNHEIDLVLSGDSDLDIFVPKEYKDKFFYLAQQENWIWVRNPVADYPEIDHFYTIDENLNVFHLHVYFKVITGESWLKEYEFPLDNFLMKNRVLHSSGIYILNEQAQSFLFALRHFIKGSSFFSRLLYNRELSSYRAEWDLCRSGFDPKANIDFIDLSDSIYESGLTGKLSLPEISAAKLIRTQLRSYLRYSESKLFKLRLHSFKTRLFNKVFYKQKKLLPQKGFILVFSGADGVGKSTMSDTIGKVYSSFLTVRKVQLGRPQSRYVEAIRRLLNKKEDTAKPSSSNITRSEGKKISLKKAFSAVYLAYLRYNVAKKAQKFKEKNYLVISDRWPTLEYDKMDGPKLKTEGVKGVFKKLAVIEKKYYDKLPFADLSIILTVPVEVAVKRNRERIKEGKETDEEIKERHAQNANHNPKSNEILVFDNNGPLIEKRLELIKVIQRKLSSGMLIK